MERNKKERTLEDYLKFPQNIEIYKALTKEDSIIKDLFIPLDFFRLLDKELYFFYENIDKYLLIEKHYRNIKLQGKQRFYFFQMFYSTLLSRHQDRILHNTLAGKSMECIKEELQKLQYSLEDKIEYKFDFSRVQKYCGSLSDITEKIKYLIEIQTDCKQIEMFDPSYPEFIQSCELEIEKLKAILQLNKDAQIPGLHTITDIPNKPIQASDFHKIMSGDAALKFAKIEQQLYDRGYIDKWKEGKDKQKLCGLIYHLDSKSFFGKIKEDQAKLNAAKRFFQKRYNNIVLKEIFRKSKDLIHQAEFKSFIKL